MISLSLMSWHIFTGLFVVVCLYYFHFVCFRGIPRLMTSLNSLTMNSPLFQVRPHVYIFAYRVFFHDVLVVCRFFSTILTFFKIASDCPIVYFQFGPYLGLNCLQSL